MNPEQKPNERRTPGQRGARLDHPGVANKLVARWAEEESKSNDNLEP